MQDHGAVPLDEGLTLVAKDSEKPGPVELDLKWQVEAGS